MRSLLLFTLFFTLSLQADMKAKLYDLYNAKAYRKACEIGIQSLNKYQNDEDYISLYAFSCLNSDNIDQLAVPITLLYRTKESRTNAAYLSTILMQKKLLLNALVDNVKLSTFNMPSTDYLLSKVFDLFTKNQTIDTPLHDDTDKKRYYKVNITKIDNKNVIIIEEYYDKILTTRHLYY